MISSLVVTLSQTAAAVAADPKVVDTASSGPTYVASSPLVGQVYFCFCAALAVVGAILTVANPNPIRGAMGLLVMIVSMAGLFLSLHAQFIAVVQIIVYAGAVVVLFLFVIMLLGADSRTVSDERGRIPRYGAAALFAGVGLAALTLLGRIMPLPKAPGEAPASMGTIEAIGKSLFTDAVVPFELSSALLIVAVVGAIAVARGRHGDSAQERTTQSRRGRSTALPLSPVTALKDHA
jgi:NADH-quinone oxidoreductase subunit J